MQLTAVESGGGYLALIEHTGISVEVSESRRQLDSELRKTVEQLRKAQMLPDQDERIKATGKVIDRLDGAGRVDVHDDINDALEECANRWEQTRDSAKGSLIIAARNEDVRTANELCRSLAAENGDLTGDVVEMNGLEIQHGLRIQCRKNDSTLSVRNRQRGTVVAMGEELLIPGFAGAPDKVTNDTITVDLDGIGRRVLPRDYVESYMNYGYATTIHGAQGQTVDYCYIVGDGLGAEAAYVAMSRARYESWLICGPLPEVEAIGLDDDERRKLKLGKVAAQFATSDEDISAYTRKVRRRAEDLQVLRAARAEILEDLEGEVPTNPARWEKHLKGQLEQFARLASVAREDDRDEDAAAWDAEVAKLNYSLANLDECLAEVEQRFATDRATDLEALAEIDARLEAETEAEVEYLRNDPPLWVEERPNSLWAQEQWENELSIIASYRVLNGVTNTDSPLGKRPRDEKAAAEWDMAAHAIGLQEFESEEAEELGREDVREEGEDIGLEEGRAQGRSETKERSQKTGRGHETGIAA
jgi:hypothetical protein